MISMGSRGEAYVSGQAAGRGCRQLGRLGSNGPRAKREEGGRYEGLEVRAEGSGECSKTMP